MSVGDNCEAHMTIHTEPLADAIPVAAERLNICKAQLYIEIRAGRIIARKLGRRTLVERSEQSKWLSSLPAMASAA